MPLEREVIRLKRRATYAVQAQLVQRRKGGRRFVCPICTYVGPFLRRPAATGVRYDAACPSCNALERHRVHWHLIRQHMSLPDTAVVLDVAPFVPIGDSIRSRVRDYVSMDLTRSDVDLRCDLVTLPFNDACFDIVFISHVLEHVEDDRRAIAELGRVLRPGGHLFVAVPVVADQTVEYGTPNPYEDYHWRAPGIDYYDRVGQVFETMTRWSSADCPAAIQPYHLEDRTRFPNRFAPLRPPQQGTHHPEVIAIARKGMEPRPERTTG